MRELAMRRFRVPKIVCCVILLLFYSSCQHQQNSNQKDIYPFGWNRTGLSQETIAASIPPIKISTIEHLQKIGNDPDYPLNGYYILTNDIDGSATHQWNHGAGFDPIGKQNDEMHWNGFSGWFDGRGHTIQNLTVKRPEKDGVGLFANLTYTAIVINVVIENGYFHGKNYVGSLVGQNSSNALATCYSSGLVKGLSRVGGLAGINRGVIEACYSTASVTGDNYVGGLVGRNWNGIIAESYVSGTVSGRNNFVTGGLVGENASAVVRNSFWATDLTGQETSAGGIGLDSSKMKAMLPFDEAGWDFTSTWTVIPGRTFPKFLYQQ